MKSLLPKTVGEALWATLIAVALCALIKGMVDWVMHIKGHGPM